MLAAERDIADIYIHRLLSNPQNGTTTLTLESFASDFLCLRFRRGR
jgi:hypothetical protein